MVLVKNTSFSGNYKENPFNFHHFNVNHVALSVDGKLNPTHPYKPDFTNGLYARDYLSMFAATGRYNRDKGLALSYRTFGSGYMLYAFDLTPESCAMEVSDWS